MPYYRGTRVPDCFRRWDSGDPECQVCQVEAMCCQAQEDRQKEMKNRTGGSSPTSSLSTSISTKKADDQILPQEGESAMSRLGKNILGGCAKETGVQIAIFFDKWRIP